MIFAAYLDDVVEDTLVSTEEIEVSFVKKITKLVHELTDEFEPEGQEEKEIARQVGISQEAKTIKLADIIDNSRDMVKNNKNFARCYVPEMETLGQVFEGGAPKLYEWPGKWKSQESWNVVGIGRNPVFEIFNLSRISVLKDYSRCKPPVF